ncbi:hypothetical protein FPV67DRAFT_1446906 [Lyophyllum atratum]|nr:hypothetical protein FPV67DRAFT_1446906 [Lyophyllum atratum]
MTEEASPSHDSRSDTSSHASPTDYPQIEVLSKGFDLLALAATFISAVQAQVMTITVGIPAAEETISIRTINSFFLGGLVLDLMSATLAFLTSRWLQRLTDEEKKFFEEELQKVKAERQRKMKVRAVERETLLKETQDQSVDTTHKTRPHAKPSERGHSSLYDRLHSAFLAWLSLSLFVPMPLLVFGVLCMICGLYVYAWTLHSWIVATVFTVAGVVTLPFLVGVFLIGQEAHRRRNIIGRLSKMQGDW